MTHSATKIFLITGVSSGLGRAFAEAALDAGHTVVGTVRSTEAARDFGALGPKAKAVLLEVTELETIAGVVAKIEAEVGPIDVLVNNAGYGHEGVLEEATLGELRRQFEVNVFAPVALMQAVLPSMRRRRSGHIVNITSMGGTITMPGLGLYHGSKFALEGLSETLAKEVAGLGIHVTAVAPGSFRTDWAGRSMVRAERTIADYDDVMNPQREARLAKSGKQLGDPKKGAQALLALLDLPSPPQHVLLGSDALRLVREKLEHAQREIDAHEALTRSTDGTPSA